VVEALNQRYRYFGCEDNLSSSLVKMEKRSQVIQARKVQPSLWMRFIHIPYILDRYREKDLVAPKISWP
jgi:hypothetical protein